MIPAMPGVFIQAGLLIGEVGLADFNSWVERRLGSAGGGISAYGLLFAGGLVASLLPCVYPLYPITTSIVRSRAAGGRAWPHPWAYYLGLCLVYGALGAIAATTGGAFNVVLRYGATNLLIAVLFLLLGLSTIGLLHVPLFQPRGIDAGKGLFGTAALGAAAGLLSSACVGPVVVSVLINLAAAHPEGFSLAGIAVGFSQMLAFGAGVGAPFLAIGLFGLKLPKSGPWMLYVQWLLAR